MNPVGQEEKLKRGGSVAYLREVSVGGGKSSMAVGGGTLSEVSGCIGKSRIRLGPERDQVPSQIVGGGQTDCHHANRVSG